MAVKTVELELNGQTYTIPLDSESGKYKKQITAPNTSSYKEENHKYAMRLKVTDVAGNITTVDKTHGTFGSKMMLRVLEKTAPVITIVKPSNQAYIGNNAVKIEFTVTDSESGVNQDSIKLQIDSGAEISAEITKVPITNGYKCTYDANIKDGSHTIRVNAKDNDGNAAIEKTSTFKVDTVQPELNISSPAESLITNIQNLKVSGSTNEQCTIKIKLNETDQGTVTLDPNKRFEKTIELRKGSNVIVITATDLAGKTTTVQREVIYDPTAPIIVSIEVAPNPVDAGAVFTITVEATDE